MTIKQVQGGWHSSAVNKVFDSREAAVFYEDAHKLQTLASAERTREEKLLDSMSQGQIADLARVFSAQAEVEANQKQDMESLNEWYKANPQVIYDGQEGYNNAHSMFNWLRSQGRRGNYTVYDWENAFQAVDAQGDIFYKDGKAPKQEEPQFSEEEISRFRIRQ